MNDNFYITLAVILLLPIIPAYILFKYLPESDTDVTGPFKGLNLKLKGAYAGYFLLVIVAVGLQYTLMNSKQKKRIEELTADGLKKDNVIQTLQLNLRGAVTDWHIRGIISPPGKEGTRFFYDDGTTNNEPDGTFELIKRSIGNNNTAKPPKWMCIYNPVSGFKIISFNRELSHPDILSYNIVFNDTTHAIIIKKPIEINSLAEDSIMAVANYVVKNPELKAKALEADPVLIQKAENIRKEKFLENASRIKFSERVRASTNATPRKK